MLFIRFHKKLKTEAIVNAPPNFKTPHCEAHKLSPWREAISLTKILCVKLVFASLFAKQSFSPSLKRKIASGKKPPRTRYKELVFASLFAKQSPSLSLNRRSLRVKNPREHITRNPSLRAFSRSNLLHEAYKERSLRVKNPREEGNSVRPSGTIFACKFL
ncbi:MAG: hypothetical protein JWO32_2025 [Bacteroidetes bacterium]|nr:hypothetical protein [Bacteroidota bacterium]